MGRQGGGGGRGGGRGGGGGGGGEGGGGEEEEKEEEEEEKEEEQEEEDDGAKVILTYGQKLSKFPNSLIFMLDTGPNQDRAGFSVTFDYTGTELGFTKPI